MRQRSRGVSVPENQVEEQFPVARLYVHSSTVCDAFRKLYGQSTRLVSRGIGS
jgi:hypothetical protein